MAFTIKTWVDRLAEFPNRRRLEPTGIENTYDVVRAEGNVAAEGDKFDAATMNDLEQRIAAGFSDTVQGATIGGEAVPKNDGVLEFPMLTDAATLGGKTESQLNVNYANTAGSAPAYGGTAADTTSIASALTLSTDAPSSTLGAGELWGVY